MPPTLELKMRPPDRAGRFTLLDLMLLIAATALGLGLIRLTGVGVRWPADSQNKLSMIEFSIGAVRTGWAFLAPLGPALLLRHLVSRGRRGKRVWRRPGIVACAAITLTFVIQGGYFGIVALKIGSPFMEDSINCVILEHGINSAIARGFLMRPSAEVDEWGTRAAFAILGAWLASFLVGRWRAEPTWIDRMGRLLGLIWVLGYSIQVVATIAALFV